jgi:hypothetical protein
MAWHSAEKMAAKIATTIVLSCATSLQTSPGSYNLFGDYDISSAFNNATRPDFLMGCVSLPATRHYPPQEYDAGSGGKSPEFPSIPYGTYAIAGKGESDYIRELSGDEDVFLIENMFDEKVQRERTSMLFHQATVPGKLISSGCIVVDKKDYSAFKKHMLEVLKEHKELTVTVAPNKKTGVSFIVGK